MQYWLSFSISQSQDTECGCRSTLVRNGPSRCSPNVHSGRRTQIYERPEEHERHSSVPLRGMPTERNSQLYADRFLRPSPGISLAIVISNGLNFCSGECIRAGTHLPSACSYAQPSFTTRRPISLYLTLRSIT